MDTIFELLRNDPLQRLFDPEDAGTVNRWLSAIGHRRPVVLVGAGFSKNAKGGSGVPLWKQTMDILARIAGVSSSTFDPLTLADYAWTTNRNACIRQLRASMPAGLDPQRAHAALFGAQLAAIITTNNLDTLLDRAIRSGYHRLVKDPDLALNEGGLPLVYFHGHRDAPETWVFARSQYEDIQRTKPLLYSKVRQLLAEHPVITVGFGLTDPNFHSVYRNVLRELGGLGEPGLALLIEPTTAAERKHWSSLGLELVRIRPHSSTKFDGAFATFFSLLANLVAEPEELATPSSIKYELENEGGRRRFGIQEPSSSEDSDPKEERPPSVYDRVKTIVEAQASFEHRLALYREYLDERVRQLPDDPLPSHKRHALWMACFEPELNDGERERLHAVPTMQSVGVTYLLTFLPSHRFAPYRPSRAPHEFVRTLDSYLQRLPPPSTREYAGRIEALVAWLRTGVQDSLNEQHNDVPLLLGLASYLLTTLVAPRTKGVRVDIRAALIECHDLAERLELLDAPEGPIDSYADLSSVKTTRDDLQTRIDGFVDAMKEAFVATGNGDYEEAEHLYADARSAASEDPFRIWLAAEGRAQAAHTRIFRSPKKVDGHWKTPDDDPDYLEARRHARAARKHPVVRSWIERAENRRRELGSTMLRELKATLNSHSRPSMSNARYWVWRSFRDLEGAYAPPHLQRRELETLLAWNAPLPPEDVLRHRFRLGMRDDEIGAELQRLANTREDSDGSANREARNEALITVGLASQKTKSADHAQLEALRHLMHWARLDDEPRIREILIERFDELNGDGFRTLSLTRSGYTVACFRAADAYLSLATYKGSEEVVARYANLAVAQKWLSRFGSLEQWGWARNALQDLNKCLATWNSIAKIVGDNVSQHMWSNLAFALAVIVDNAGSDPGVAAQAGEMWLKKMTNEKPQAESDTWFRSVRLLLSWALEPKSKRSALLEREADHQAEQLRSAEDASSRLIAIANELQSLGSMNGPLGDLPIVWLRVLRKTNGADRPHPDDRASFVYALGRALCSGQADDTDRAFASTRLIDILADHPEGIADLPRQCLVPSLWGEHWRHLLEGLKGSTANIEQGRPMILAISELHRNRKDADDIPHSDLIKAVEELPLANIGSSDGDTARAAVQAIGFLGQTKVYDDQRVGVHLQNAARDPRVKVRAALAYAAARLSRFAHDPDLRSRASTMSKALSESSYLSILHAHALGTLEPQYFDD